MDQPPFAQLSAPQANALAAVLELEAVWENVPVAAAGTTTGELLRGLTAKQRAFDAYRAQQLAYNRQFRPAHHGERPATTPRRLGAWCRRLAAVYRRADHAACPVHVLDKARRCADRLAARLSAEPCPTANSPSGVADAAADLGSIADWCDGLAVARQPE